jgi:hypothetical protein
MDAADPDRKLRAPGAEVKDWEKFEVRLYPPGGRIWVGKEALSTGARNKAKADFDALLHRKDNARLIEDTTIELAPGLTIRLLLQADVGMKFHSFRQHCPSSCLCIFEDRGMNTSHTTSYELIFTGCVKEWDTGVIPFRGDAFWLDRTTSIVNNQPDSTVSYFYDVDKCGFYQRVLSMYPRTVHYDLYFSRSEVDDRILDKRIGGAHVCGRAPSPWLPDQ